jgi:Fe-S cluster assembly protein SufD
MSGFAEKTDIKSSFREKFESFASSLNGSSKSKVHEIRKKAFSIFEQTGFPGLKDEEYKYTHLGKAIERNFEFKFNPSVPIFGPDQFDSYRLKDVDAYELVFVNGQYVHELSSLDPDKGIRILDLDEAYDHFPVEINDHFSTYARIEKDAFIALNTAFSKHGAFIKVEDNHTIEKPVLIYNISEGTDNSVSYPRNLILVGRNSKATVVDFFISSKNQKTLTNAVTEAHVQKNSGLEYYKIQTDIENNYHVGTTQISQERDTRVNTYTITLNGNMVRNNLNIALDGENCETHMYGLYLLHGNSHVDNHTLVDHRKPNSFSNELYKGVLHDNSIGVFNGKIYVQQDAQKTNAFQSNKNILLNDQASVNTKPQLEIWADDVKCSHGCTIGQLDDEQVFYLRTRGLSEDNAKAMLLIAFVDDILQNMKIVPLKNEVNEKILNRLHKDFTFN